MYFNSLAVGAIPSNSKILYVTVKYLEILSNYSLYLHDNITFKLYKNDKQYDIIKLEESSITCDMRYFLLNTFLN